MPKFDLGQWLDVPLSDKIKALARMVDTVKPMPPDGSLSSADKNLAANCLENATAKIAKVVDQGPPRVKIATRLLLPGEMQLTLDETFGPNHGVVVKSILPEVLADPFAATSTRTMGPVLIEAIEILAAKIADAVGLNPAIVRGAAGCDPMTPVDKACVRKFVEAASRNLWVASATAQQIESITEMAVANSLPAETTNEAAAIATQALIQHPMFLYFVATRTNQKIDNAAALAWLSLAILGRPLPPNIAARAAELDDFNAAEQLLKDLLEDRQALVQLQSFHAQWLGYDVLPHAPALSADLYLESAKLVERVVYGGEPWSNILSFEETYLTPALAAHYKVAPLTAPGWVNADRKGILMHGSFLANGVKGSDTSPTQRGKFVLERLLCGTMPPPPPEVNVDEPPARTTNQCKLDSYKAHMQTPGACASCHQSVDPIGFGLENYDGAGVFRADEIGRPDCKIDGVGSTPELGTFTGPVELQTRLSQSTIFAKCLVRQYMRFVSGQRDISDVDVERGFATFTASREEFKDFAVQILLSAIKE